MTRALKTVWRGYFLRCICVAAWCAALAGLAPASAQSVSLDQTIRDLDIAIAVPENGGQNWIPSGDGAFTVKAKLLTVTEGQTIEGLLRSENIKSDDRSLAVIKALNPDLSESFTIHVGQEIALPEIEGAQADPQGLLWGLVPYQTERREAKTAFDALEREVNSIQGKPNTTEFRAAFEAASAAYRNTFWEDREMQLIVTDTFQESLQALGEARLANFDKSAADTVLADANKRLHAFVDSGSRMTRVPLKIETELLTGTPKADPVSCLLRWAPGGDPSNGTPVYLPLAQPIEVPSLGNVLIVIKHGNVSVSEPEYTTINWQEIYRQPLVSKTIKTRVTCG